MSIEERIEESIGLKKRVLADVALLEEVQKAIDLMTEVLKRGNKVLLCGNGGSAADAQHLACELSGRFYQERQALNAEALQMNTAFLTAVANDYDFSHVFTRALQAKGTKGDLLWAISTSGNSPNVVKAAEYAKSADIHLITMTGKSGGVLAKLGDISLHIDHKDTARIQEVHMLLGHIICEKIEDAFINKRD